MLRDFEDCIEIEHGKRKFNFDKIYAVFNNELNDKNRLLSKLKDKNKVLKHQKAKLLRSVRQYMEDKEITGLILQLSNLNTQSCINKIWLELNSTFWAVWAAKPEHTEISEVLLKYATFEGGILMFSWTSYIKN